MRYLLPVLAIVILSAPTVRADELDDEIDKLLEEDKKPKDDLGDDGSDEDPNRPNVVHNREPVAKKPAPKDTRYPQAYRERPLTLYEGMFEIVGRLSNTVDPATAALIADARYGVTKDVQLQLSYGAGGINSDGFSVGKTLVIGARYQIFDYLSAEAKLPILVDPFAMAVSLGAPMRFRLFDKLAIFIGEDAINIKLAKFIPLIEQPFANDALIDAEAVGTQLPDGNLQALTKILYQYDAKLALSGDFGIIVPDFDTDNATIALFAEARYAKSRMFDLGARTGFSDLGSSSSFTIALYAALRI